jgi:hypothetical protein
MILLIVFQSFKTSTFNTMMTSTVSLTPVPLTTVPDLLSTVPDLLSTVPDLLSTVPDLLTTAPPMPDLLPFPRPLKLQRSERISCVNCLTLMDKHLEDSTCRCMRGCANLVARTSVARTSVASASAESEKDFGCKCKSHIKTVVRYTDPEQKEVHEYSEEDWLESKYLELKTAFLQRYPTTHDEFDFVANVKWIHTITK